MKPRHATFHNET